MLVARGLVDTRGRAQGLVMGGHVRVDGQVVTKAGTRVADDATVEVAAPDDEAEPLPGPFAKPVATADAGERAAGNTATAAARS